MEKFLLSGTAQSLLAGICVVLCLHLILNVGKFVYQIIKKKAELSEKTVNHLADVLEKNTKAVEKLNSRIDGVEGELASLSQIKIDLRRLFVAIKYIAGENWPTIKKQMLDDELPK